MGPIHIHSRQSGVRTHNHACQVTDEKPLGAHPYTFTAVRGPNPQPCVSADRREAAWGPSIYIHGSQGSEPTTTCVSRPARSRLGPIHGSQGSEPTTTCVSRPVRSRLGPIHIHSRQSGVRTHNHVCQPTGEKPLGAHP